MTRSVSRQQAAILDVIRDYTAAHGYPPSVRDIGAAVGLTSSSTVAHHLAVLAARGYIRRDGHRPRALIICETP